VLYNFIVRFTSIDVVYNFMYGVICVVHKDVYVVLSSVLLFAKYTGYIIYYLLYFVCFYVTLLLYSRMHLWLQVFHAARVVVLLIQLCM
jgi:hypothetical protein